MILRPKLFAGDYPYTCLPGTVPWITESVGANLVFAFVDPGLSPSLK